MVSGGVLRIEIASRPRSDTPSLELELCKG
jgi:hypothetical protein